MYPDPHPLLLTRRQAQAQRVDNALGDDVLEAEQLIRAQFDLVGPDRAVRRIFETDERRHLVAARGEITLERVSPPREAAGSDLTTTLCCAPRRAVMAWAIPAPSAGSPGDVNGRTTISRR